MIHRSPSLAPALAPYALDLLTIHSFLAFATFRRSFSDDSIWMVSDDSVLVPISFSLACSWKKYQRPIYKKNDSKTVCPDAEGSRAGYFPWPTS